MKLPFSYVATGALAFVAGAAFVAFQVPWRPSLPTHSCPSFKTVGDAGQPPSLELPAEARIRAEDNATSTTPPSTWPAKPIPTTPSSSDAVPVQATESSRRTAVEKVERRHGEFFAMLSAMGRDPSKFREHFIEKEQLVADIMAVAREQGFKMDDTEARRSVGEMVTHALREHHLKLRSLVSDADYKVYMAFERTAPERSAVRKLSRRLESMGAPLTQQQSDQLTSLLVSTKEPDGRVIIGTEQWGAPAYCTRHGDRARPGNLEPCPDQ